MTEIPREFQLPDDAFDRQRSLLSAHVAARPRPHSKRNTVRGRRVVVLAVAALAVVVGAGAALGIRALVLDKGFVGLPPEDATPSAPEAGELVLSFGGRSTTDERLTQVWVYADGRLIWARPGYLLEGANDVTTGLLEQRLTPAGVERLRSEVASTGVFDHDLALSSRHVIWGEIVARVADRLVTVRWANPDFYASDPDNEDLTPATPDQERALERLDALLPYPGAGLPASAWEDKQIRAYVPSTFSVCYEGVPAEVSDPQSDPSRVLSLLPATAREILGGKDRTRHESLRGWARGPYYPSRQDCSSVTTEEARAVVSAFDAAGLEREDPKHGLAFSFDFEGPVRETGSVVIEPLLPDGEWTSFRTG
jgi:hypothetical protein